MSSFITLAETYDARESMPTVEATNASAIRTGVLRAVAEGRQEGADLSALWTPKSGKRQGVPSNASYIMRAVAGLLEAAGISETLLHFDVRNDGTHDSVVVYNAEQWNAYVASLSDDS